MVVLQVEIVDFGLCSCVPAVFANVHLGEKKFECNYLRGLFSLTFDLLCL